MTMAIIPTLPTLNLSDDDVQAIERLQGRLSESLWWLDVFDAYYDSEQAMTTLGIALPPELQGLRTVLGWPRLAVDSIQERLDIEGFRYPNSLDADNAMWEVWQRNDLDVEFPLAVLDALIHSRSHLIVGAGDEPGGPPLVTVESARNLAFEWDARRRGVKAALQLYTVEREQHATYFLPDETIELVRDATSSVQTSWTVESRDQHRVGWTPVLPMVNRARIHDRHGRSEITTELRSITDAACRAILRMDVGAEFFSTPQRYALGASEQDLVDADGNLRTAWETYIGRFLFLERDEEGNVPTLGQFAPGDPAAHTAVLDQLTKRAASITGLPLSYFGMASDNPASADAIRMDTDKLVQRVKRKQRMFESAAEGAMRAAIAFQQGQIPDQAQMIETIWRPPEIPTPAATSAAIQQQVASGYLPATSDVTGERLGYSPAERARIERDRQAAAGDAAIQAIAARALGGGAQTGTQSGSAGANPAPGAGAASPRPAATPSTGSNRGAPASRPPAPGSSSAPPANA